MPFNRDDSTFTEFNRFLPYYLQGEQTINKLLPAVLYISGYKCMYAASR